MGGKAGDWDDFPEKGRIFVPGQPEQPRSYASSTKRAFSPNMRT